MKKILVISSSFRKVGNSDTLADSFINGALENDNDVEKVYLCDKTIAFCRGCNYCQTASRCAIKDGAVDIVEKMSVADIIVFVTPVYYYGMSGQLKTLLDRANSLYNSDYTFREIYLLATAADESPYAVNGTEVGVQGWVSCFERARLVRTIFAGGVTDVGDIADHPALEEAYNLGRSIC